MKLLYACIAILLAAGSAHAETKTFTDDSGRQVEIQVPVERAAIFNRYNVEFFRAVGAMGAVIGMDSNAADNPGYWPDFDMANVIGAGQSEPNYEAIVELDPDVVVLPRNGVWEEMVEKMEPFGIPVMVITGWDTLQHVDNTLLVGEMTDRLERAKEVAAFYQDNMKMMAERLDGVEPRSVYLEQNASPLVTPIPGSGWHDMITVGGGRNIFGDVDIENEPAGRGSVHSFQVDAEEILVSDPEAIVKLAVRTYIPSSQKDYADIATEIAARPGWSSLSAANNNEIHVVSGFAAGAVSKMIGSAFIAKALHAELFEDLDPEDLMRRWIEDFQGLSYEGPYSYSQSGSF